MSNQPGPPNVGGVPSQSSANIQPAPQPALTTLPTEQEVIVVEESSILRQSSRTRQRAAAQRFRPTPVARMTAPIRKKKNSKKKSTPVTVGVGSGNQSQQPSQQQQPQQEVQPSPAAGLSGPSLGPTGRLLQGFNLVRNATQTLGFRQPENMAQFLMESGMYYVPWGSHNRTLRLELRKLKDVLQSRTNQLVIDINREIDNVHLGAYQHTFIPEAAPLLHVQSLDIAGDNNPGNPVTLPAPVADGLANPSPSQS
ncbi:hypothetical protein BWQ96_08079 [Gracilariopsis chorda]|uniref:Uncharacterized protein n=1 Tax=Gracilariopsis chorda TaxID=448386 RepID=A0A2V3IJG8_9FLOR|nr:hypothetical protein BWQ96_08079 [Gracilariopsis chorda]|eukprot:PXF42211.1 hypothetical protein BWQ96_08079 [Gracilariopsis chorda]